MHLLRWDRQQEMRGEPDIECQTTHEWCRMLKYLEFLKLVSDKHTDESDLSVVIWYVDKPHSQAKFLAVRFQVEDL